VQIKISARHGNLSENTREKIQTKVEKLLRFHDRLSAIEVTVDLEHRETPEVDLRVLAEHKHDFVATTQADELLAALDIAVQKVEQQLRKHKEKIQDRHRGAGHRRQGVPEEAEE